MRDSRTCSGSVRFLSFSSLKFLVCSSHSLLRLFFFSFCSSLELRNFRIDSVELFLFCQKTLGEFILIQDVNILFAVILCKSIFVVVVRMRNR